MASRVAQASESDCAASRACIVGSNDYNWIIGHRASGFELAVLTGDKDVQTDSWLNRNNTGAAGYDYSDGTGDCIGFWRGSRDNNVAP